MSKARGPYRVDPLGYKKANEALDKMAENARELGLDYEPVWDNLPSNKDVEDAMRLKRLSRLAEQPAQQQEPVVRCMEHGECFGGECIYTSPPAQRTWVGLSDLDMDELENEYMKSAQTAHEFLRAIEAALRSKNT